MPEEGKEQPIENKNKGALEGENGELTQEGVAWLRENGFEGMYNLLRGEILDDIYAKARSTTTSRPEGREVQHRWNRLKDPILRSILDRQDQGDASQEEAWEVINALHCPECTMEYMQKHIAQIS